MSTEKNKSNTEIKSTIKKTTTYPIELFNKMIADKLFDGNNIKIVFRIQEVGGDLLDRFPGTKQVVSVDIIEET